MRSGLIPVGLPQEEHCPAIVRRVMTRMSYEYRDGRNVVTMMKKID